MSVGYSLQFGLKLKQALCSTFCLGAKESNCKPSSTEPISIPTTITVIEQVPVTTEVEVTKVVEIYQTIEIIKQLPCLPKPITYLDAYRPQIHASNSSSSNLSRIHPVLLYTVGFLTLLTVFLLSFRRGLRQNQYKSQSKKTRSKVANRISSVPAYRSKSIQTMPTEGNEAAVMQEHLTSSPEVVQQASNNTDNGSIAALRDSYESQLTNLREQNASLEDDNERYLRAIDQESRRANGFERTVKSLEKSKKAADESLISMKMNAANSDEQLAKKRRELEKLRNDLNEIRANSEKELKELKDTLVSRDEQLSHSREEINLKELDNNELRDKNSELTKANKQHIYDIGEFETYVVEGDEQIEKLGADIAKLKADARQAEIDFKAVTDRSAALQQELIASDRLTTDLQDTLQQRKYYISALEDTQDQQEKENNKLEEENNDLKSEVQEVRNSLTKFMVEKQELWIQVQEEKRRATAAKNDKEAAESELETLGHQLSEEETDELRDKNIVLQNDVNALNETVNSLRQSESDLTGQLAEKDWQLAEKDGKLFHFLTGSANQRVHITDLNAEIGKLRSQIDSLKVEKDSLAQEKNGREEEWSSKLQQSQEELSKSREEAANLRIRAQEMEEDVTALQNDKEVAGLELKALRHRLSEAETALNAQAAEIHSLRSEKLSLTGNAQLSIPAFKEHARLGGRTMHTIIVDDGKQDFSTNKRKDRKKMATKRAKAEVHAFVRDVNFVKSRRLSISAGSSYAEVAKVLTLKETGFATRQELKEEQKRTRERDDQMQATITTAISQLLQEKTKSNNAFSQLSDADKVDFTAQVLKKCEATMPHLSLDAFTSTHHHPTPQKDSIESRISLWTKPRILSLAAVTASRAIQREEVATAACKHMHRTLQHRDQKRHSLQGLSEIQQEKLCPNHTVSPQIQNAVQTLLGQMEHRLAEDCAEQCTEICMRFGNIDTNNNAEEGDASLISNATDVNVDGEHEDEYDDDANADNAAGHGKRRRNRKQRTRNQQG